MEPLVNSHAQLTVHLAAAQMFVLLAIITIILMVTMDALAALLMLNAFSVVLLNQHSVSPLDARMDSISAQETAWPAPFIALLVHQLLSALA